jgi:hypothetical protein
VAEAKPKNLLILPKHDEYEALEKIAGHGSQIEGVDGQWGTLLAPRAALKLDRAKEASRVLIIKLRCRDAVAALRRAGYTVDVIDSRCYRGERCRGHSVPSGRSVGEQLAAALGLAVTTSFVLTISRPVVPGTGGRLISRYDEALVQRGCDVLDRYRRAAY